MKPSFNIPVRNILIFTLALFLPLYIGNLYAEDENIKKGMQIAEKWDMSDFGFQDSYVELTMTLLNRHGERSSRKMRQKTLEMQDLSVGDKTLIIFDFPKDVKGTAFLSFAKILSPDEQWLYLPALKRIKRVSSVNKSGPFLGSEFAFEDIAGRELGKYDYEYSEEVSCGEKKCDVVLQYPKYENSGYSKLSVWYDTIEYRPIKIEFFDRKDDFLKVLDFYGYEKYDGKYWRAHKLHMQNMQTGKETVLEFSQYSFRNGYLESEFRKSSLNRLK